MALVWHCNVPDTFMNLSALCPTDCLRSASRAAKDLDVCGYIGPCCCLSLLRHISACEDAPKHELVTDKCGRFVWSNMLQGLGGSALVLVTLPMRSECQSFSLPIVRCSFCLKQCPLQTGGSCAAFQLCLGLP